MSSAFPPPVRDSHSTTKLPSTDNPGVWIGQPAPAEIRASSTVLPLTQRYMEPAGGGVPVTVGDYRDFGRIRHGALNEGEIAALNAAIDVLDVPRPGPDLASQRLRNQQRLRHRSAP